MVNYKGPKYFRAQGKESAYDALFSVITSLQQEQPECIYGRTLEEREKCCKFCSAICEARIGQDQPEVDLEKEIDKEWAKCEPMDEGMGLESANIVNEQFDSIARHFYELGLNARNEEKYENKI